MSRGFWDYKNEDLKHEMFGWNCGNGLADEKTIVPDVFRDMEMSEMIYDMFAVLYAADSWKCGDWGEESYREVVNEFKNKWLNKPAEDRAKMIVDKQINKVKNELYKSFGIRGEE